MGLGLWALDRPGPEKKDVNGQTACPDSLGAGSLSLVSRLLNVGCAAPAFWSWSLLICFRAFIVALLPLLHDCLFQPLSLFFLCTSWCFSASSLSNRDSLASRCRSRTSSSQAICSAPDALSAKIKIYKRRKDGLIGSFIDFMLALGPSQKSIATPPDTIRSTPYSTSYNYTLLLSAISHCLRSTSYLHTYLPTLLTVLRCTPYSLGRSY